MRESVNKKDQRFFCPSFFPKTRRGQFYLIAAIVIIGLIAGMLAITNYSKKQGTSLVYDLKDELEVESGKFLDRSAVSGNYSWNGFESNFSKYAGKDINIIYVVEDSGLNVSIYNNGLGQTYNNYTQNGNNLTVSYGGSDYGFVLRQGKDFYFIISQYIGDEKYVAHN